MITNLHKKKSLFAFVVFAIFSTCGYSGLFAEKISKCYTSEQEAFKELELKQREAFLKKNKDVSKIFVAWIISDHHYNRSTKTGIMEKIKLWSSDTNKDYIDKILTAQCKNICKLLDINSKTPQLVDTALYIINEKPDQMTAGVWDVIQSIANHKNSDYEYSVIFAFRDCAEAMFEASKTLPKQMCTKDACLADNLILINPTVSEDLHSKEYNNLRYIAKNIYNFYTKYGTYATKIKTASFGILRKIHPHIRHLKKDNSYVAKVKNILITIKKEKPVEKVEEKIVKKEEKVEEKSTDEIVCEGEEQDLLNFKDIYTQSIISSLPLILNYIKKQGYAVWPDFALDLTLSDDGSIRDRLFTTRGSFFRDQNQTDTLQFKGVQGKNEWFLPLLIKKQLKTEQLKSLQEQSKKTNIVSVIAKKDLKKEKKRK